MISYLSCLGEVTFLLSQPHDVWMDEPKGSALLRCPSVFSWTCCRDLVLHRLQPHAGVTLARRAQSPGEGHIVGVARGDRAAD